MPLKKQHIKRVLVALVWGLLTVGGIVLLVSAIRKKESAVCAGLTIDIQGVANNFFIDEADVLRMVQLHSGGQSKGRPVDKFNLRRIETELKKEVWIKDAQLYFDNNNVLQVIVKEREPIARVYTISGNSFYIDSSNAMLPLSEKFSARLPLFTNFPSDAKVLSRADSSLLNEMKLIALIIQPDAFLMGMIEQIDINANRYFDMVPKIGKQVIEFGSGNDAAAKFEKLKLFYKNVMPKAGWSRYSSIDLKYKNQVVARLRDKEDVVADSLRTLQLMKLMAQNAELMAADSVLMHRMPEDSDDKQSPEISLIQQSMEREEDQDGNAEPVNATTVSDDTGKQPMPASPASKAVENKASRPTGAGDKTVPVKPAGGTTKTVVSKPTVAKPSVSKPAITTAPVQKTAEKPIVKPVQKPKAVMGAGN